jgi:hypothetical protein
VQIHSHLPVSAENPVLINDLVPAKDVIAQACKLIPSCVPSNKCRLRNGQRVPVITMTLKLPRKIEMDVWAKDLTILTTLDPAKITDEGEKLAYASIMVMASCIALWWGQERRYMLEWYAYRCRMENLRTKEVFERVQPIHEIHPTFQSLLTTARTETGVP